MSRARLVAQAAAVAVALGFLGGCGEDEVTGPTETVPGVLVETVRRTYRPDTHFFTTEIPALPDAANDRAWREEGTWLDEYTDAATYPLVPKAWFESRADSARAMPVVARTTRGGGSSMHVRIDQGRGTMDLLGLMDHTVWVEILVYRAE